MPVLSCIVGGVFITCAVCGHIEPTQIFAESSPTFNRLTHVPRWTRFPPSSYQNQKFVYKKTVSAKDNLSVVFLLEKGESLGTRLHLTSLETQYWLGKSHSDQNSTDHVNQSVYSVVVFDHKYAKSCTDNEWYKSQLLIRKVNVNRL